MLHGAFPVSLHKPWVALIPLPQQAFAPPGLRVQPLPAQVPHSRGQLESGAGEDEGERQMVSLLHETRTLDSFLEPIAFQTRWWQHHHHHHHHQQQQASSLRDAYQTMSLVLMPSMPPGHVWPVEGNTAVEQDKRQR